MPGFLLHVGATVLCMHAGQAQPTAPFPRILLNKQPVVTLSSPYAVAGCAMPPPPAGNGPCVSGQFITSATRILAGGVPVLLQDSSAVCIPTGTGLMPTVTQIRVRGI
jgi:hypothetical protein